MKFKILLITLFLYSCNTYNGSNYIKNKKNNIYHSRGFALIYNETDYSNKIISRKLDNAKFQIAHRKLGYNKSLAITNPSNNKSLELKVTKKAKYPNFFNIVITEEVSNKLNLDKDFPYVEVRETVKNRSFVAKKAEMYSEEKKVFDKAPVASVKISNISKNKLSNVKKLKKKRSFYILIGEFYSKQSANSLKNILIKKNIKKDLLIVKKLGKNRYELSSGPYRSINTLKNDHFKLNKYGFEDLDIKQK